MLLHISICAHLATICSPGRSLRARLDRDRLLAQHVADLLAQRLGRRRRAQADRAALPPPLARLPAARRALRVEPDLLPPPVAAARRAGRAARRQGPRRRRARRRGGGGARPAAAGERRRRSEELIAERKGQGEQCEGQGRRRPGGERVALPHSTKVDRHGAPHLDPAA